MSQTPEKIAQNLPDLRSVAEKFIPSKYEFDAGFFSYLDSIANSCKKYSTNEKKIIHNLESCTRGFLKGKCEKGHTYAKQILCSLEWCADCGQMKSKVHLRRINRWYDKVFQIKKLGYMVITIPENVRNDFLDKELLLNFRRYIKRLLKRQGMKRGMMRYHWAGDCPVCKGKGCEQCNFTGASYNWNPHLNIMHEVGYIEKQDMMRLKKLIARWINKNTSTDIQHESIVIWNRYTKSDKKKQHILRYVTRATWRYIDYTIINTIKGFRNCTAWGKWEKFEIQDDATKLEHYICPICDSKIKYEPFVTSKVFLLENQFVKHIDRGFFKVKGREPPET